MAGIAVTPFTEKAITTALRDLQLGGLRYFETTSSTNDFALTWATEGVPDLSLVIANEQTAGRGRSLRAWYTPAGAALAFSIILRPKGNELNSIPLFSGLGALAVCLAIEKMYTLRLSIKWPNDVLFNGRKFCGILAEAVWTGNEIDCIVLGIGLNVARIAVPSSESLKYPATSLEGELHTIPDRVILLHNILVQLLEWRPRIEMRSFIETWDEKLAFKGKLVQIQGETGSGTKGVVDGLESDGSLRLKMEQGKLVTVHFGEVHLRP